VENSDGLVSAIECDTYDMPVCSWIDPPSIELGEYLPFWRDLEFNDVIDKQATTCNDL
jgi:hypothetical protein